MNDITCETAVPLLSVLLLEAKQHYVAAELCMCHMTCVAICVETRRCWDHG